MYPHGINVHQRYDQIWKWFPGNYREFGNGAGRQIEAIVNITIAPNANGRSVRAMVNNGQSQFGQTNAFKVAPAALTMSPNAGTEGETLNVTLTGWTFPSGTTVLFGSSTSGITVNSVTVST